MASGKERRVHQVLRVHKDHKGQRVHKGQRDQLLLQPREAKADSFRGTSTSTLPRQGLAQRSSARR